MFSNGKTGAYWTHIEDLKDPIKLQLPGRNRIFILPRAEESKDTVALASFGDILFYICDGPAIRAIVSGRSRDMRCQLNPRH